MKSETQPVVEVKDVIRKFGERRVIDDLSFQIDRGDAEGACHVMGHDNGSHPTSFGQLEG